MALASDHWIARMAKEQGMIEPFESSLVSRAVVSFGPSSYGYDLRLSDELRVIRPPPGAVLDPKNTKADWFQRCGPIVPANSYVLGRSLEYFRIPRDCLALVFGKSTYARCGLVVNVTPLEPEWEGHITMALCNTAPVPLTLYPNEGIAQVVFLTGGSCRTSYADRKGKYQAQKAITPPRVE